ncbi:MAG: FkbM family methyltransferase [Syntrophorhabdales bacterium]|jgi:FkbM family methyltransferase
MTKYTNVFSLRAWKRLIRRRLFSLLARRVHLSYSAYGEDLIAWAYLSGVARLTGPEIRYIDIGAADPIHLNNTYLLSTLGAHGVLIEPDPDQAAKLHSARPDDITVNAGIAFDDRQSATLIRFNSPVFNTFSESQADLTLMSSKSWLPSQRLTVVDRIEVSLIPINKILEEHGTPHFLSIDTEGLDFKILKSIDFSRFCPWIICMETIVEPSDIEELLKPYGYQFTCRTPENVMFILPLRLWSRS